MSFDMATGKIMTVRGPIDPNHAGTTLMHEHLFQTVSRFEPAVPDEGATATELDLWDQKLAMHNLLPAQQRKQIADNWVLADEDTAVEEAMEFRKMGGDTMVEVTSIGLRRDPIALRRVSVATGLNVVMGSGWYQKIFHPADMAERGVEDLAHEIIRDITIGVGGTGIRSGIIGEVGIEGNPIEPGEVKSLQASVRASRATGAAISLHLGGKGREKLQTMAVLAEAGVDTSRVIFGHSDSISHDMPLMLELLGQDVYILFDLIGRLGVALDLTPVTQTKSEWLKTVGLTAMVAAAIPRLIEAGYADRILLSHDMCNKIQLKRYGGTGYSFILERFLPHLRARGVSEEHIRMMMVENPKRVLTLAEPVS